MLISLAGALAACAPPVDPGAEVPGPLAGAEAPGPLAGKADGTDAADRGCQVILRSFAREPAGGGRFTVENGYWVWLATVDVARPLAAQGATAAVLYHPDLAGRWWVFQGAPVDGGGAGFQRFVVRVANHTTPTPAMEPRSWEYQRAELAVYAALPSGGRLFDHNRVGGDLANYTLTPSNDFVIAEAPAVCPVEPPRAQLDFAGDHTQSQHGAIVAGGVVSVRYALQRLPGCRYSRAGYQLWDIEANVKFQPQGVVAIKPVTMVVTPPGAGPTRQPVPADFTVPPGTQYIDIWFRNFDAERCQAWDSQYGANYRFGVDALAAPVGWAGNWGGSFARDCTHRDGLAEPIVIDEYVRERACAFADAEVWVPGLTDADPARPERLWADAVLITDGDGVAAAPVWLSFQGRVGNNWRFRYDLPYELRAGSWSKASFRFRFSNDGNHFYEIGPRSLVRAP